MDCRWTEEQLTAYMDRALPPDAMEQVAQHLAGCRTCATLAHEVRSLLATCSTFPDVDPGPELLEKILLRTSGRARTRSLRERLDQYVFGPLLTPRLAMGAAMSLLFVAFSTYWISPRVTTAAAALSPRQIFHSMDRAAQGIYGGGLKLYDKTNEWQAELSFIKSNVLNRLGFMIEQLDVPVQGNGKSVEPGQQQPKAPSDKSSSLLLPV